jgi:hypothetical protein
MGAASSSSWHLHETSRILRLTFVCASQSGEDMREPNQPGGPAEARVHPPEQIPTRPLLNRRQLAAALGLSERSIDNLQHQRKIPVVKISPRCCRYDLAAVLRALEQFIIREVQ